MKKVKSAIRKKRLNMIFSVLNETKNEYVNESDNDSNSSNEENSDSFSEINDKDFYLNVKSLKF